MQLSGFAGGFYRVSEWIMRLAIINLLWILFTFTGLIIFGMIPATIAMFAVIRKWLRKEDDFPIFKTFWTYFKKDFIKGNAFGIIMYAVVYVLYIDLQFLSTLNGITHGIMLFAFSLTAIFFTMFVLYFFPVYVHFELSFIRYFKQTIMLAVMNLHVLLMMVIGIVAAYYIFYTMPGLAPFFGISIPAFYIMGLAHFSFKQLEWKQAQAIEKKQSSELKEITN